MPHSSGGGSIGGGFHGGSSSSSSSSSSTRRYSSRPFPGAICYVYYDRSYRPHLLYADDKPETKRKLIWLPYVFIGVLLIFPILLFALASYHHPSKLKTNYDTTIVIEDQNNVLNEEDENTLNIVFASFLDKTGITPAFISVDKESITSYSSLEDYAYDSYVNRFKDEKHWLIVYSSNKNTLKDNWAFEGMQGNDTDPILYTRVTDKFNETLYNVLSNEYTSVGESLRLAFDEITPHILDQTFYVEIPILVVSIGWSGGIIFLLIAQIMSDKNHKNMQKAIPLKGEPSLKVCPYCNNHYYAETVENCPKCGKAVEFPINPHLPKIDNNEK